MKHIIVAEVMNTKVEFIDGMQTITEALTQIRQTNTKCLIVNKRNAQDEYGILLISDIASQVLAKNKSPTRTNVYEIMTKPIITVSPNMDIRYCARLFEQFNLSRAAVIVNDKIIGIVSFTNMALNGLCKLSDNQQ